MYQAARVYHVGRPCKQTLREMALLSVHRVCTQAPRLSRDESQGEPTLLLLLFSLHNNRLDLYPVLPATVLYWTRATIELARYG